LIWYPTLTGSGTFVDLSVPGMSWVEKKVGRRKRPGIRFRNP